MKKTICRVIVQYTEFPGVDHNGATNTAYARADLIEWMLRQRRP